MCSHYVHTQYDSTGKILSKLKICRYHDAIRKQMQLHNKFVVKYIFGLPIDNKVQS